MRPEEVYRNSQQITALKPNAYLSSLGKVVVLPLGVSRTTSTQNQQQPKSPKTTPTPTAPKPPSQLRVIPPLPQTRYTPRTTSNDKDPSCPTAG